MANELLPCPFCGGPAEIYNPFHMIGKPSQPATYRGGVRCRACGCESKATTPPDGAITTWNRRADATPQASAVAGEAQAPWGEIREDANGDLAIFTPNHNAKLATFSPGAAGEFVAGDVLYAAPQASATDFAKLQSAYVAASDRIGELLAEKQASAENAPVAGEAHQLAEALRDWHGKGDGVTTTVPDELVQALYGFLHAASQASRPDFADAYEGAREDLAIWKRRALEAERDLRAERETSSRLVAELNAQNGPTHMGEPAPQASDYEVVGEVAFSYDGEKVGAFYGDAPPIETMLYIARERKP